MRPGEVTSDQQAFQQILGRLEGVLDEVADHAQSPQRHPFAALEVAGREYYEFRAALMIRNNEGLTKTYNRFHDPSETSPDIRRLRDLHGAMDRAVLDAYGWTDIQPTCEFLLDYEDEDEEEDEGRSRRRKKPWRYRWPDDIRDEVLARLLKVNAERAAEERRTGAAAAGKKKATKKKAAKKKPRNQPAPNQTELKLKD